MRVVIQVAPADKARALAILIRRFSGTGLPNCTFIIPEEAVRVLREEGIQFTEISRDPEAPRLEGVAEGERI